MEDQLKFIVTPFEILIRPAETPYRKAGYSYRFFVASAKQHTDDTKQLRLPHAFGNYILDSLPRLRERVGVRAFSDIRPHPDLPPQAGEGD